MSALEQRLAANLAAVRRRIEAAAERAGRRADAITLVAVTKYVDARITRALVSAGCHTLGESRPQQLWQKAEELADLEIQWHLIGHLQRNKIRRTLPLVHCIHSVDSQRLLDALDEQATGPQRTKVLLEINISQEPEKTGLLPAEACRWAPALDRWPRLDICGLMAMTGRDCDDATARQEFAQVRQLRDRLQTDCPAGVVLNQLSMGMSGDFELAIEEGATMVRVGSALYEGLLL